VTAELTLAEERERKRLAAAIHDNLSQLLLLSIMKLDRLKKQTDVEKRSSTLADTRRLLDNALQCARTLTADLRPPLLGGEDDVRTALMWVAKKMEPHGLTVTVRDHGKQKRLDDDVLIMTYQAVQELLWNVLKHSGTDYATIRIDRIDDKVQVVVEDSGRGFDRPSPAAGGGFGLVSISERLTSVGGDLTISSIPGQGTRACITVPMKVPDAAISRPSDKA
jgi:signal transduction histidine kinase